MDPASHEPPARHRLHARHLQLAAPFGSGSFGRGAEAFARFFGTPGFLIGQTAIVVIWIAVNAAGIAYRWDPYPFILLNLAFSLQAAYAAPLILLAQTRQADRDKVVAISDAEHRDAVARAGRRREDEVAAQTERLRLLLESNIRLTAEIHARLCEGPDPTIGRPDDGADRPPGSSCRSMPPLAHEQQPETDNRHKRRRET